MIEKKTKVTNRNGLHMRPSMVVVDVAGKFNSDVTLVKKDMEVDAKSIMSVTMLAAVCNDEITVKAEGPDEEEAVDAIVHVIKNGFLETLAEK